MARRPKSITVRVPDDTHVYVPRKSQGSGGDDGCAGCLIVVLALGALSLIGSFLDYVATNWRLLIVALVSIPGLVMFGLDMRDRVYTPNRPTRAAAILVLLAGILFFWLSLGHLWDDYFSRWLTKTWTETEGMWWWKRTVTRQSLNSDDLEIYRWTFLLLQTGLLYALWRLGYLVWRKLRSQTNQQPTGGIGCQ